MNTIIHLITKNSVTVLASYLLFINLLGFVMMGVDKHKARRATYRIPERTLFAIALFGGTPGSLLGMLCFHHKTRKLKFTIGMPLILIAQIVLCLLFVMEERVVFR